MYLDQAKALKLGQLVRFPADRGAPGGSGKVTHVGSIVHTNHQGTKYVWVSLKVGNYTTGWPSNRLI